MGGAPEDSSELRSGQKHSPVREEHTPPHQDMRLVTGQSLEPLQHRFVNSTGAELVDELVIVNGKLLAVGRYASLDVPGSHDLCVWLIIACRLDRRRRGIRFPE